MRILIVIAILLTTTTRLYADDAIKNYINISKRDGLANNSVSVIEDDVYGRIWIGTEGGLSIYDSDDLTTIDSYAGIEILTLYDTGREMLIGTSAYIESYDYETGLFERVVFEGKDLVHVTSVLKYRDDVIIVANASVFIYANGSVRLVKSEVPYGLLESDKYGVLWGINNTNNVYRLDENYELVKTYRLGKADDHSLRAISLFPDSKGLVWIGTLKDGLYRYNRVDDTFHKEDLASMYNMNEIDNILSINEDKDDRLWIGHNSKVSVYDYNNRAFRSYMFENIWNITLSTTITKIHRTRDRNMVLGSYFNGLFYVKDMDSNMKFFNVAGERKEEGGVVANGIVKDSDNRIWVGTNSMGISVLDATGRHIKQLTPDNSGISNDMIAMDMDEDGNIWSGSRSNGLYRISKNGTITRFFSHSGQEGTLSGNDIPALHSINRDSLIVGTSRGIDIYLRKTNTFVNLAGRDSRRFLFCNILPHNNKIWLVSYRSVWCFDRADGTIKEYPFVDQNAGLLSAYINEDGKLWLGTTQGDIFLFEDGNITPYITDKVLIGSSVAGIQGDADGNLWVAAGNNLLRVAQDKNIRKFDMSWGLGTMEFTARSSYVDGDGTIYFGSSNGLFSFNPKLVGSAESNHPKLFISDFKILDRSINSENSDVLKKHIHNTDKIVLNNDQNFISFYVTSIDYNSNYLSTTCMYRLENFDKNWYEVNERSHEISFTGLTAGSYTLNIRLISDNGEIVDSKSIDIDIKPHFLLSPVMIIVYIIVITLLIWGASVLVTKQRAAKALVRQAKAEQDEITRMNTLKLDLFTNISYAFKIPLSIISMLQEDLLPGNDEPDNDTVIFKRNVKRLEFLINQLMEFRNLESRFVPVEISKYDIVRLLELSYEAFIPLYEHKNISYRLIKEVDDLEILIDAEKMEILFGNLLGNSFKQTREGGECYVKIHRDERYVVVDVFHSGPCLNDVQKREIFQPYTNTDAWNGSLDGGIGLAIVNSIAKLMDIKMSVITYEGEGNILRAEIPVITDDNVKLSVPKNRTDIVGRIIDNTMFTEEQLAIAGNAPGTRQTFQLLVVDSDGDTRKVLKRKLQEHFNVSTASTGKEALLLMKSQNMDAIISSLQLPEMDGYELCKIVKGSDRTRHIPFIMLSEDLSAESKIKGFRCGADLFVQKPVNIQEILLQLDNILRNKNFLRTYYANLNQLDLRKPEVNNADEIFIKELTEYIYAHLADNKLSVQELSRHTGISRTQLYMNIKRLTDHSPTSFVLNIKMAEAKKLLLTTDMTSSEISYKLGYCNSNHFSRQFKEYYNLSPGAFRKQQQN